MYMKKIILSLVVLLVLVVAASYMYQSSKKEVVSDGTDIPSVVIEDTILLYPESGDVTFKPTPNDDFRKVTDSPTVIPNQAIVHTGIGKASVLLPDNSSISLDNNTEITVNYSEKSTSIYQTLGTTYHRVQKLLSGKTYQVQTAGTLAAVRGTKFAVKFDDKTKKTKIAVTESKVQVTAIPKITGSTTTKTESMLVEAGTMVSVDMVEKPKEGVSAMHMTDTTNDSEMRNYIEEQKNVDVHLDNLKKEYNDPVEFRKEMKRVMFSDVVDTSSKETSNVEVKKETTEVKSTTEATKPTETTTVKPKGDIIKPTGITDTPEATVPVVVKKIDEEQFFNGFEPLFIKYFYLDETDSTCNLKVTPAERVTQVKSFAEKSGYPFTKTTLSSFAQAIDTYCSRKDEITKVKLQNRFDEEYPYEDQ